MLAKPTPPAVAQAPAPPAHVIALASTLKQKALLAGRDQPAGHDRVGLGAHAASPLAYVPAGHVVALNAQKAARAGLYAPAAQGAHTAEEMPPTRGLKEPAAQGRHTEEETPPSFGLNVPAGQGEGFTEEKGQNDPAGHSTGAPEAQNEPAGQGTQVSARTRWFAASPVYSTPEEDTARKIGQLKAAAAPKASRKPAPPLPAMVVTRAVSRTIARMRWPRNSAT